MLHNTTISAEFDCKTNNVCSTAQMCYLGFLILKSGTVCNPFRNSKSKPQIIKKYLPQFFLLPRIPCKRTAVGGSIADLSI